MTDPVVVRALSNVARGGRETAVVDGSGAATYGELRDLVDSVARRLRELDVAPRERVGVLAPKGRFETAALLAVWKVGASVVPLDTASPELRNRRILDGAGVRVVVGAPAQVRALGRTAADPSLSTGGASIDVASGAADEAIVLHTSGSTGVPKGVPVSHAGVTAFVDWMSNEFDVRPGDAVAALASPTFDLALFEQLAPLAARGTILRPDDRTSLSVKRLGAFLDGHAVACIYAVPSFYVRLLSAPPLPAFRALRTVLFAGETFPVRSLRELRTALPGRVFANLFGPTETNVSTFHRLRDDDPGDDGLPVGVPCPYIDVAIVEDGREADEGELVARGPTVLSRYVGGDVTPARKIALPGRGDAPFLLTGDRVARGADGLLRFHGRMDDMLKVRGFRVEPGEVEAALTSHPAVADALVRRELHATLGEVLVADVALRAGAAADANELRSHAALRLPAYMTPTEVRVVAELPRSERGKRRRG